MSVKRKKRGLGEQTAAGTEPIEQSAVPGAGETVSPPEGAVGNGSVSPGAVDGAPAAVDETQAASAGGSESSAGIPDGGSGQDDRAAADRIRGLEAELAEAKDLLLRKAADFDNVRKRIARDKEESVRYANAALVTDLIEVIDGLERAIASTEVSKDFTALHEGVVLIEKQLVDNLQRKWGLERMKAAGTPFDPALHQAIMVGDPVDGDGPVVLEELQSGYLLHDRVVRPAKVKVSATRPRAAPPPEPQAGGSAAEGDGA